MSLTKRAKILTHSQINAVNTHLSNSRLSKRNLVIFHLSVWCGFRSCEIARLKWNSVLDAEGELMDEIHLYNSTSKGSVGGRIIPMPKVVKRSITDYLQETIQTYKTNKKTLLKDGFVIRTQKSRNTTAQTITNLFFNWYRELGMLNSSHSGRRTAATRWSKKITSVGGSLREVQKLLGHASLSTTQKYIETDNDAMRRVVDLV